MNTWYFLLSNSFLAYPKQSYVDGFSSSISKCIKKKKTSKTISKKSEVRRAYNKLLDVYKLYLFCSALFFLIVNISHYDRKPEMFCHWQSRESPDGDIKEAGGDVIKTWVLLGSISCNRKDYAVRKMSHHLLSTFMQRIQYLCFSLSRFYIHFCPEMENDSLVKSIAHLGT